MPLSRITSASIDNSAISAADIADGTITAAKIISVANTQITGNIVSSQIASVNGSVITANTIANSAIQTGAVENYMSAAGLGFGMRNRIINGGMVIDQRNAGASVSFTASTSGYTVDRMQFSNTSDGSWTAQRSTTTSTGFINSLLLTVTVADASLAATQFCTIAQSIEGFNVTDLGWGTANAQTVTLSFWVRSSLTGTFGGSLVNSAQNRSYPFTYTINAANTFEQKTVTIAGDTTGTWLTDNGIGIRVYFGLGVGSTYSGTAGAWGGALYISATGATSVVGTNGATFYITGAQLEKGSTATSFDSRAYSTELAMCQRYYYKMKSVDTNTDYSLGLCDSTTSFVGLNTFPVTMRTVPTALEQSGTVTDYKIRNLGVNSVACSSVPIFVSGNINNVRTIFTTASGLTGGQCALATSTASSGYLAWSAEL